MGWHRRAARRRRRKEQQLRHRRALASRLPKVLLNRYPGYDPEHPSSWSLRLVRMLPVVLIAAPERVVVNGAFVMIGLGSFLANEVGSVPAAWPQWVLVAWTFAMAIGGLCVEFGMFRANTTVERLGYLLVGPACLLYAITVLVVRGWAGLPVFLIFSSLAGTKAIRMIISSAERDMTIEYGQQLDRNEAREDES